MYKIRRKEQTSKEGFHNICIKQEEKNKPNETKYETKLVRNEY